MAGLTPAQHQLLLAIRGHPDPRGPTITDVAAYLLIRHHSAVGLVNRAVRAGLVQRVTDPSDARVVRLRLARAGARSLADLVRASTEELARLRHDFAALGGTAGDERSAGIRTPAEVGGERVRRAKRRGDAPPLGARKTGLRRP
jgi:DNA-binding MarR family transcriptional regulator